MSDDIEEKKAALWALCEQFVADQTIFCAETVYQSDRVIENAYAFIADVCEIVGYAPLDDDDDEDDDEDDDGW
jgi:hypothetical protein